jgi:hypothetical protein
MYVQAPLPDRLFIAIFILTTSKFPLADSGGGH